MISSLFASPNLPVGIDMIKSIKKWPNYDRKKEMRKAERAPAGGWASKGQVGAAPSKHWPISCETVQTHCPQTAKLLFGLVVALPVQASSLLYICLCVHIRVSDWLFQRQKGIANSSLTVNSWQRPSQACRCCRLDLRDFYPFCSKEKSFYWIQMFGF